MGELTDLEARVRALEDIEAIKKLKARYFRCVDQKQWDEMEECFPEDAVADYGSNRRFEGRKAIMDFFRVKSNASRQSVVGMHQGHNPEIDLTGDSTAIGTWQLFAYTIDTQTNIGVRDMARYRDEYVKAGGTWKIKSTNLTSVFREKFDRKGMSLIE